MSAPRQHGEVTIGIPRFSELVQNLREINKDAQKAVQATLNDFKNRAPAWVSAGVTEVYGIKKSDVKATFKRAVKGPGVIRIRGVSVDNIQLEYEGRRLTPTHFKMKPTKPPTKRLKNAKVIQGAGVNFAGKPGAFATVHPIAPYQITAEFFKGKRQPLRSDVFLAENNGSGFIPFQRTGDGRTAIKSIRTLSIPQMITGRAAEPIQEKIEEGLSARLNHNVERAMKQSKH